MAAARIKLSVDSVGLERLAATMIGHVDADGIRSFSSRTAPRTSSSRNDEFLAIALRLVTEPAGSRLTRTPISPWRTFRFRPSR